MKRPASKMVNGGMPFDKVAQSIELLGTEAAPVVRREMAKAASHHP